MKYIIKEKTTEVLKEVNQITNSGKEQIVRTYFDQELNTKLTTDKPTIIADETDTATITASIYNYLDEAQTDQTVDVPFILDGVETIITASNGVATIEFNSTVAGEYIIKTNIPNYRNGEVVVIVEG